MLLEELEPNGLFHALRSLTITRTTHSSLSVVHVKLFFFEHVTHRGPPDFPRIALLHRVHFSFAVACAIVIVGVTPGRATARVNVQ